MKICLVAITLDSVTYHGKRKRKSLTEMHICERFEFSQLHRVHKYMYKICRKRWLLGIASQSCLGIFVAKHAHELDRLEFGFCNDGEGWTNVTTTIWLRTLELLCIFGSAGQ